MRGFEVGAEAHHSAGADETPALAVVGRWRRNGRGSRLFAQVALCSSGELLDGVDVERPLRKASARGLALAWVLR